MSAGSKRKSRHSAENLQHEIARRFQVAQGALFRRSIAEALGRGKSAGRTCSISAAGNGGYRAARRCGADDLSGSGLRACVSQQGRTICWAGQGALRISRLARPPHGYADALCRPSERRAGDVDGEREWQSLSEPPGILLPLRLRWNAATGCRRYGSHCNVLPAALKADCPINVLPSSRMETALDRSLGAAALRAKLLAAREDRERVGRAMAAHDRPRPVHPAGGCHRDGAKRGYRLRIRRGLSPGHRKLECDRGSSGEAHLRWGNRAGRSCGGVASRFKRCG